MINARDGVSGQLDRDYKERLCCILSGLPSRIPALALVLVERPVAPHTGGRPVGMPGCRRIL